MFNDRRNVRAYFIDKKQPILRGQMETEIRSLVAQVGANTLTPLGYRLGALDWSRKSYIVLVLDDQHHHLTRGNAFMFVNTTPGLPHPFRDGADIQPFGTITGFYCTNHMTTPAGQDPAQDWSESYEMAVCHNPAGCTPPNPYFLGHFDSGTNMGPPIPPP